MPLGVTTEQLKSIHLKSLFQGWISNLENLNKKRLQNKLCKCISDIFNSLISIKIKYE